MTASTRGNQVRLDIYRYIVLQEAFDVVDLNIAVRILTTIELVEVESTGRTSRAEYSRRLLSGSEASLLALLPPI